MALTDNEKEKAKPRNKRKRKSDFGVVNTLYSDAQKLEAVSSYLALGNLALVGRVLGIPEITLRKWKATDWWKTVVEELKMQERIELSARMKRIVEASQTIVAQRLETGDPIWDQKAQQVVYKPVSMKDAHKVAVDLIDRRKDLEKLTVDDSSSEKEDDRKLEKLAEKFAEMATMSIQKNIDKKRTVDVEIVEVNDVEFASKENDNAVSKEREAQLQGRVCQVSRPPRPNQSPSREDDGAPSC